MATTQQSNRQGRGDVRGVSSSPMDVELRSGDDMADEQPRTFLVGQIIMAVVFALLMPLTVVMYIDILAVRATVRAEAKELRKLKEELRPKKEVKDE